MTAQVPQSSRPVVADLRVSLAAGDADAAALLRLLHADAVDAAIEAGLMRWPPAGLATVNRAGQMLLVQTRQRLLVAWAARERFRARQARLQCRERERQARRAEASAPAAGDTGSGSATAVSAAPPPLPAAAAAALARARARAVRAS